MHNYLKNYLLTSILFVMYLINYITLSENGIWLYFASFFDYQYDINDIFLSYFLSVPFISFVISRNTDSIFSALMTLILLLGVLPGSIIYSLSSLDSKNAYYFLYIFIIFVLSMFSMKKRFISKDISINININLFIFISWIGIIVYMYLLIKYHNIINIRGISDVYIQRTIFKNVMSGWEGYPIMFSKSISVFSLMIIAIYKKNKRYLIPIIFIFIIDYGLAGHKSSIVLLLFCIYYYFYNNKFNFKFVYINLILIIVFIFTLAFQILIMTSNSLLIIVVGLYDRIFFVTSTLFAMYHDFANTNYFFYGGHGLIGKLIPSSINESYTNTIGTEYFSEGVSANADLISDGYINFGIIGSIVQLLILLLIFNKRDNYVYSEKITLLFPFIILYSLQLFSMGLQTTLLTGGMIFFILLVKFGFKIMKKE